MAKGIFLRTPYNYDTDAASNESGLACEDASLTQQHFRDETDINNILRQFNVTGLLPETPVSPKYGDFTGIGDYHTALLRVMATEEEFMNLPANIRARFDNDAGNLIEFLNDDNNREEAEKLGLVEPKQALFEPTPEGGGEAEAQLPT